MPTGQTGRRFAGLPTTEAGDFDEAEAMLDLLPGGGWPAGVATLLIPAARARLRLAQGRPAEALADFEVCAEMSSPGVWGMELSDVAYLHARSGAAQALHVWRIIDSRAVEFREFQGDQQTEDEFWMS